MVRGWWVGHVMPGGQTWLGGYTNRTKKTRSMGRPANEIRGYPPEADKPRRRRAGTGEAIGALGQRALPTTGGRTGRRLKLRPGIRPGRVSSDSACGYNNEELTAGGRAVDIVLLSSRWRGLPCTGAGISIGLMNPRMSRTLAKVCVNCPVCRRARKRQRGMAYGLVKGVEGRVCPFGRAYARVYERRPHEPVARS